MSFDWAALRQQFAKPMSAAAAGALVMELERPDGVFQFSPSAPILAGQQWSMYTLGAVMGFTTSYITETLNGIFLAQDKKDSLKYFPSFAIHVGASVGAWYVIPAYLGNLNKQDAFSLGKVGLITEITTQWIYEYFVAPGGFGDSFYSSYMMPSDGEVTDQR